MAETEKRSRCKFAQTGVEQAVGKGAGGQCPTFRHKGQDYIFALTLFDSFTTHGQLKFVGNQRITRKKLSTLMFPLCSRPLLSPALLSPSHSQSFHSLSLEVGPFYSSKSVWEAPLSGSVAQTQPKLHLVHFYRAAWNAVAV